jgi:hemerythrin-like domain-containing protein
VYQARQLLSDDHEAVHEVLQQLLTALDKKDVQASHATVADTIREIEKRLATHNEIEENQIYHLAGTILSEPAQIELSTRINAELENRPPRFSAEAWVNK